MNRAKHRVLIAAPEADARELSRLLRGTGFRVVGIAATASEAAGLVEQTLPDLAIMDLDLKGKIIATAKRIRRNLGIPVLFLTIFDDERLLERATKAEPAGYVRKPLLAAELHASVDAALRCHQAEEKLQHSETMHRLVVKNISDTFFITDEDGNFTYICPNVRTIFGYSQKDVSSLGNISRLFGKHIIALGNSRSKQKRQNIEAEIRDKQGKPHTLLVSIEHATIGGGSRLYACRDISDRMQTQRQHDLLLTVTRAISRATNLDAALKATMGNICKATGWGYAEAWVPSPDQEMLLLHPVWYGSDQRAGAFRKASESFTFPRGVGLPGRIWQAGKPEWIEDMAKTKPGHFLRRQAAMETGLVSSLGVPIAVDAHILLVLVFHMFHTTVEKQLVDTISAIARQLGVLIQRKQEESRLQVLLDAIPDHIFFKDINGRHLLVNRALARFAGGKNKIIGKRNRDLLPAALSEACDSSDKEALAGKPVHLEEILPIDGEEPIYLDTVKAPIRDPHGNIIGLAGISRDVTQQKLLEQAIKESRQRYRSFVQNFHGIAFRGGMDFKPIFFHGAVREITGYTEQEFLRGKPTWDRLIHPDDLPSLREGMEKIRRQPNYGTERQYRIIRKDGEVRWVQEYIRNVCDESGRPLYVQGAIYDISAYKTIETALRRSEEKFRNLFELANDGIFLLNPDGSLIDFNRVAHERLGYSKAEMLAMHITEVDTPEAAARVPERLAELRRHGHARFESTHQRKDGSSMPVEVIARIINFEGREAILSVIRDITERKHLQAMLQASHDTLELKVAERTSELQAREEQIRLITDNIPVLISYVDADECYRFNNEIYARWFGLGKSDLLGRHVRDIVGSAAYESIKPYIRDVLAGRQVNFESKMPYRNSVRDVSATYIPHVGSDGRVLGFFALVQDISARRQAEEAVAEMAMFAEVNPAPVLKIDRDGAILLANRAARRLSGENDLKGKSWFDYCPTINAEALEHLLGGIPVRQQECACCDRQFLFTYVADLKRGCVYVFGTDISERKLVEAQLLQSQKMEAVGQLAGGVAHDFNSLLGVILGYGDMMRDEIPPDGPLRDNLEEIMTAGSRAKALVRELVDFSRPKEEGRKPLNLTKAIGESVKMLRASLPTTIRIQTRLRAGRYRVLANAGQIGQVLINLGINASDAIGGQRGEISIGLNRVRVSKPLASRHKVPEGPYLRLTICDTGHGMDEKTMAKCFEPFFTTKEIGRGTGLGLAVVHGIIKSHGGFVNVESIPGQGSCFHVYLPAVEIGEGGSRHAGSRPAGGNQ